MAQADLYEAARELLDAAAAALATTPAGAPGTRYVSSGPPVYDCCDLLTVHVSAFAALPMGEAGSSQRMPQMRPAVPMLGFVVTMLRCYPIVEGGVVIAVPLAQKMEEASFTILGDGWTVFNHLRTMARNDRLFAERPCRPIDIGPMTPTPTQGGCAGWALVVAVEADGYAPVV